MAQMNIFNMADAWAAADTEFYAIKMSVTDTASLGTSKLIDLLVNSASKFSVDKFGYIRGGYGLDLDNGNRTNARIGYIKTGNGAGGFSFSTYGGSGIFTGPDYTGGRWGFGMTNGGGVRWSINGTGALSAAMSAFDISADPNACSTSMRSVVGIQAAGSKPLLNLYDASNLKASFGYDGSYNLFNSYTDSSNYDAGVIRWNNNAFEFVTNNAGTGAASGVRSLRFGVNNLWRWEITDGGHIRTNADNAYDIGLISSNRPRNIYAAGSIYGANIQGSTGRVIVRGDHVSMNDAMGVGLLDRQTNVFYNYQNRFTVTDTGTMAAGQTFVRTIEIPASMRGVNGITYADGRVYVFFYSSRLPESVSIRFWDEMAQVWRGPWSSSTNITTNTSSWGCYSVAISGNYLTKLEVTVVATPDVNPQFGEASIEYHPTRSSSGINLPNEYVSNASTFQTFGGGKNTYPALKRSGTELQVRLADDTDFTSIVGKNFYSYNLLTDANNYERGYVGWSANEFVIGTQKAGAGALRNISIASGYGVNVTGTSNGAMNFTLNGNGAINFNIDTGAMTFKRTNVASTSQVNIAAFQHSSNVLQFYSTLTSTTDHSFRIATAGSYVKQFYIGAGSQAGGQRGTDVFLYAGPPASTNLRAGDIFISAPGSGGTGRDGNVILQHDNTAALPGYVGIGTNNPEAPLHVIGDTKITGTLSVSLPIVDPQHDDAFWNDDGIVRISKSAAARMIVAASDVTAVFLYDVSKDSDGGAWRKKVAHTSWMNETLGTSTRGVRAEFPSKALIVTRGSGSNIRYEIYDLDDPACPMWMVFTYGATGNNNLQIAYPNGTGIVAMNGLLCICGNGSWSGTTVIIDFIADRARNHSSGSAGHNQLFWNAGLAYRNSEKATVVNTTAGSLASDLCNSIAATVLPHTPPNPLRCNLPNPTVNVQTNGGQSTIRADGTVYSGTATTLIGTAAAFMPTGELFYTRNADSGIYFLGQNMYSVPSTGTRESLTVVNNLGGNAGAGSPKLVCAPTGPIVATTGNATAGLCRTLFDRVKPASSLAAYINDKFNTGYVNGDTKLALAESSTDLSDLTGITYGPELVTRGSFDKITGWELQGTTGVLSITSLGRVRIDFPSAGAGHYIKQLIPTQVGKSYDFTFDIADGGVSLSIRSLVQSSTGTNLVLSPSGLPIGTHSVRFTATTATTWIQVYVVTGIQGAWAEFDNISCKEVIGELVTNGKLDQGTTGWANGSGNETVAVVGGRLRITRAHATDWQTASQTFTGLTAGRRYVVRFNAAAKSGAFPFRVNISNLTTLYNSETTGDVVAVFTASGVSHTILLGLEGGKGSIGDYVEFDNISVMLLSGIKPELLTNGDFTTNMTGWTENGGNGDAVINAGRASLTNVSGAVSYYQSLAVTPGKTYEVSGVVNDVSSGENAAQIRIGTSAAWSSDELFTNAAEVTAPPSPFATANFVSGSYVVDGQSVALTSMFRTDDTNAPFNANYVEAGIGFTMADVTGGRSLSLASATSAVITAGATQVIEFQVNNMTGTTGYFFIRVFNDPNWDTHYYISMAPWETYVYDGNAIDDWTTVPHYEAGLNRLAVTFLLGNKIAVSMNGSPAAVFNNPVNNGAFTGSHLELNQGDDDSIIVKSWKIYEAVDDVTLASLSVVEAPVPIGYANFADGSYYLNGVVGLGDILDANSYDTGLVVSGKGLVVDLAAGGVAPEVTPAVLSAIAAGVTMVMEVETDGPSRFGFGANDFNWGDSVWVTAQGAPDGENYNWAEGTITDDNGSFYAQEFYNKDGSNNPQPLGDGIHRIALTLTPSTVAFAFPGQPSYHEYTGRTMAYDRGAFDLYSLTAGGTVTLRSITFYAPMAGAALPELVNAPVFVPPSDTLVSGKFVPTASPIYVKIGSNIGTSGKIVRFDNLSVKEADQGLGANLVTNGGFDTDTAWTKGTGWTISGGKAVKTAGTASNLVSVASVVTAGKLYKLSLDVTDLTGGNLTLYAGLGGVASSGIVVNGRHSFYLIGGSTDQKIYIQGNATFAGSIDNLEVREVTDSLVVNGTFDTDASAWFADTLWAPASFSVVDGTLEIVGSKAYNSVKQAISTVVGRTYQMSATITGSGYLSYSNGPGGWVSTSTTQSTTFVASAATTYITAAVNGIATATFDDITLTELPSELVTNGTFAASGTSGSIEGWSINTTGTATVTSANGVATLTSGTGTATIYQTINGLTSGQPYRLRFTPSTGSINLTISNISDTYTTGAKEIEFVATASSHTLTFSTTGGTTSGVTAVSAQKVDGLAYFNDFSHYADTTAMLADGWTQNVPGMGNLSGGALHVGGLGTTTGYVARQIVTTPGATYRLTVDVGMSVNAQSLLRASAVTHSAADLGQTIASSPTSNASLVFTATGAATWIIFWRNAADANTTSFDNIRVRRIASDRSVATNHPVVYGTVTRAAVASGADVAAYSGFSAANYLEMPYSSSLDFGTGDFCVMGWCNAATLTGTQSLVNRIGAGNGGFHVSTSGSKIGFYVGGSGILIGNTDRVVNQWYFVCCVRFAGVAYIWINGVRDVSAARSNNIVSTDSPVVRIGHNSIHLPFSGSMALWRVSASAPTPDQIKAIYEAEKPLFQPNAKALLVGSPNVQALAYDDREDKLYAATTVGTNVFRGLQRVGYQQSTVEKNRLTSTEDFSSSAWLKLGSAGSSVTSNATFAPNGTLTADKFSVGTGTGSWYIAHYGSPILYLNLVAGQAYTFSIWLKAAGYNYAFLRPHNNTVVFGASGLFVNLINGAITYPSSPTVPGSTATAIDEGDGWWRVEVTSIANAPLVGGTGGPGVWPCPAPLFSTTGGTAPSTFTGDGSSGVYLWGAQFEDDSTATSYAPAISNSDNHKFITVADGNAIIGTASGVDIFTPRTPLRDKFSMVHTPYDERNGTYRSVTTNATPTDLLHVPIGEGRAYRFKASVGAAQYGGTTTERAAYIIEGIAWRDIGGNIQVTATTTTLSEITATMDCSAQANTTPQTLSIRGTGKASTTIAWVVRLELDDLGLMGSA